MRVTGDQILGIDVGGSGVKGALVDISEGELLTKRYKVRTLRPATPPSIVSQIQHIIDYHEWEGLVGVGFPAVIDNGIVHSASNIHKDWIETDIMTLLNDSEHHDIYVVNDADAAGLAEIHFGAGKGKTGKILLLTIGTGIGSALFLDGNLVTNTELGHLYLKGQRKVAEKYVSNAAREREELDWKDWAKRFDEYLMHVNALFYPDLIILGGGISKHFEKYGKYFTLQEKIVPAQLKNNAGIVGAALFAETVSNPIHF
ncbi:MAG: ROK family protein [Bacteroidia bacterium]|nr:ROK family protein [Bacteroidia bacterium]